MPYSYFGAPESYNTTYNAIALTLPNTSNDTEITDIKKTYEPDVLIGETEKFGTQESIPIYNLSGKYAGVITALTGYDSDGNMVYCSFQNVDISGGKGIFTADLSNMSAGAVSYAITVFDNFTNLNLLAPYKELGTIVTENEDNGIGIKADLTDYIGKKSITLIADCEITEGITAEHIKYLHGENITKNSYKNIPFADNEQGAYYIRTGIYGENAIDETKNTVVNISPDNDGVSESLNTWSFTSALTDDGGNNPFTVTGGASLESGHIKLNSTSAGTATMTYSNPVMVSQGGKVMIEFDIYCGRQL